MKVITIAVVSLALVSTGCSLFKKKKLADSTPRSDCQSAKEYVTTFKYLQSQNKQLALQEDQIRNIAYQVADGCTGAAKRFVSAFNLLTRVEVGSRTAMQVALRLSHKSESHSKTYLGVFKYAYLAEHLDLDLQSSLKVAEALSLNFKGNTHLALKDFARLVVFCREQQGPNLPVGVCAQVAGRVAKKGEEFKKPMAKSFMEAFKYIHSDSQLNLSIKDSLNLAEKVVSSSPYAVKNFKVALEFGLSAKGLKLSAKDALGFAQTMAAKTMEPSHPAFSQQRLPASK